MWFGLMKCDQCVFKHDQTHVFIDHFTLIKVFMVKNTEYVLIFDIDFGALIDVKHIFKNQRIYRISFADGFNRFNFR